MSDAEPKTLDYSREKITKHYSTVAHLAEKERSDQAGYVDQFASEKDKYVRLASSSKKEDRDEAAQMRNSLRFNKLDLWRAINVDNFLKGKNCAPGSEFLTYAWLMGQNDDLRLRLESEEKSRYTEDSAEIRQILNDQITAISSCIVDIGRRFPAGIATFKATESFFHALPNFIQGARNIIHSNK